MEKKRMLILSLKVLELINTHILLHQTLSQIGPSCQIFLLNRFKPQEQLKYCLLEILKEKYSQTPSLMVKKNITLELKLQE